MDDTFTLDHLLGSSQALATLPGRVLGIDLGTTNSIAAEVMLDRRPESLPRVHCIPIDQETETTLYRSVLVPSIIALHGNREYVGEGAKRLRAKAAQIGLKQNRNVFWECKNDIGVRRTYHQAPEGFRSAPEISGKILSFIKSEADRSSPGLIRRTIVTVPASFQAAQRTDTIDAAKLAGIQMEDGDLLDEPLAAFLDVLLAHPDEVAANLNPDCHLLVFDFGGGTCDVAVLDLVPTESSIDVSARAVSRFHRLGGGDIDRAIVYDVLVPQFCQQNNLAPHDLDYSQKRLRLEPALLSVAEALKIQLCAKIQELENVAPENSMELAAQLPDLAPIPVDQDKFMQFHSPRLTAGDFEKVLAPFLDRDLLCVKEDEYRQSNSIFSPIQDALDRAGLAPSLISMVLMVGGSSLIPGVRSAIRSFFPSATFLGFDDYDRLQTTVARGAAIHAYTMEVYGKPLFRIVAHDSICIKTADGIHKIVEKGEPLPDGKHASWRTFDGLAIAATNLTGPTKLRIEFIADSDSRMLFSEIWEVPAPVSAGDHLTLRYRFTQNQVFEFQLAPTLAPDHQFRGEVERPLTHVVNPHSLRVEIEEIEEQMRERTIPEYALAETGVSLAEKYAELGQTEKAISLLKASLRQKGRADSHILNLLGIYSGRITDTHGEERYYREAAAAGPGYIPLFNLALAQRSRGDNEAALRTIEGMEARQVTGPGLTLKATVLGSLNRSSEKNSAITKAISLYPPLPSQADWELGWFHSAILMKSDQEKMDAYNDEKKRRSLRTTENRPLGELPILRMPPANRS